MVKITIFGSCRVALLNPENRQLPKDPNIFSFADDVSATYSTPEVLQWLDVFDNKFFLEHGYHHYCGNHDTYTHTTQDQINIKQKLSQTDIFIIEICSLKTYNMNGYYVHPLRCTPNTIFYIPYVANNTTIRKQEYDELENDMIRIVNRLKPAKVLFVTHFNVTNIDKRQKLINYVEKIGSANGFTIFNPTDYLNKCIIQDKDIQFIKDDLIHYTLSGEDKIKEKLLDILM